MKIKKKFSKNLPKIKKNNQKSPENNQNYENQPKIKQKLCRNAPPMCKKPLRGRALPAPTGMRAVRIAFLQSFAIRSVRACHLLPGKGGEELHGGFAKSS